jgi:hypothetical protein
MKLAIAAALLLASVGVHAQVTSTSGSQVQTSSGAVADAGNRNNVQLENNFEAGDHMRYDYGTQRVEQVAPLALGGAAAGFSNENCANTGQIAGGTFWFNFGKATPEESERCNARRDAGVYIAMADDAAQHAQPVAANSLRSMAWAQKCNATPRELAMCKRLGLVDSDGNPVVLAQVPIPSRPAGTFWQDGRQVDMRGVPVDNGSNVRHNP